jgi:GH24 family phage-related lysozyme (muramidase)
MRSSRAAVDLIVSHEVTSKAVYERKYQRPEWPGGASGITVGIGYDLGYNTGEDIFHDWKDYLPPDVIRAMQRYAGIHGAAAHKVLAEAQRDINVPWDAAMAVFMTTSLPKFEKATLRAIPAAADLPAGCFGVLASITYNRGASYTAQGDRYREMRNIRALVTSHQWDKVEYEIRSMKRLWRNPPVGGLLRRRDEEADLWKASLAASNVPAGRTDTGDDKNAVEEDDTPVTPEGNDTPPNVQPTRAKFSIEVQIIQRELIGFKYYEVGDPDGLAGGKFVAGVAAFMNDRGKDPNKGRITPELKAEIAAAKADKLPDGTPWSRPISTARANATAKDIAPKVASVNATWYTKLLAWIMGIPAFVSAGLQSLFGDDKTSYIGKIKEVLGAVPSEFYLLGIAALALGIFLAAKTAQDATVKDYNEGKIN